MKKIYQHRICVRGYELDAFGHVNNAQYLHYMEDARWQMLREEGITLETFKELQRWPVIAAIEVKYLKPLYLGDWVDIETTVIENSGSSFLLEQKLLREDQCVMFGKVKSVVVNETGKPVAIPATFKFLSHSQ